MRKNLDHEVGVGYVDRWRRLVEDSGFEEGKIVAQRG